MGPPSKTTKPKDPAGRTIAGRVLRAAAVGSLLTVAVQMPQRATAQTEAARPLIDAELDPGEISAFDALLATLKPTEAGDLTELVSRLPEAQRGLFVASVLLPEPELAGRLARHYDLLDAQARADFAAKSDTLSRREPWPILVEYLRADADPAAWARAMNDETARAVCIGDDASQHCTPALTSFIFAWFHKLPVRMINAEIAPHREVPWQVELMRAGPDAAFLAKPRQVRDEIARLGRTLEPWERNHLCGGVYLGGRHVLTAAHCVEGWTGYDSEFLESRRVLAGTQTLDVGGTRIPIRAVAIHAGYTEGRAQDGDDIALIELDSLPQGAVQGILPVTKRKGGLADNTTLTVTGWGLTGATRNSRGARDLSGNLQRASRVLMAGYVTLLADSACNGNAAYRRGGVTLTPGQLCAGSAIGVDACRGDSGGPAVYQTRQKVRRLVALVSWGPGCGIAGVPGLYTDVGEYVRNGWLDRAKRAAAQASGKITAVR